MFCKWHTCLTVCRGVVVMLTHINNSDTQSRLDFTLCVWVCVLRCANIPSSLQQSATQPHPQRGLAWTYTGAGIVGVGGGCWQLYATVALAVSMQLIVVVGNTF